MWYTLMKNKVIGPVFFFVEHAVIGDTFLTMMQSAALHHVSM
jgi:hypothetical protein